MGIPGHLGWQRKDHPVRLRQGQDPALRWVCGAPVPPRWVCNELMPIFFREMDVVGAALGEGPALHPTNPGAPLWNPGWVQPNPHSTPSISACSALAAFMCRTYLKCLCQIYLFLNYFLLLLLYKDPRGFFGVGGDHSCPQHVSQV